MRRIGIDPASAAGRRAQRPGKECDLAMLQPHDDGAGATCPGGLVRDCAVTGNRDICGGDSTRRMVVASGNMLAVNLHAVMHVPPPRPRHHASAPGVGSQGIDIMARSAHFP